MEKEKHFTAERGRIAGQMGHRHSKNLTVKGRGRRSSSRRRRQLVDFEASFFKKEKKQHEGIATPTDYILEKRKREVSQ